VTNKDIYKHTDGEFVVKMADVISGTEFDVSTLAVVTLQLQRATSSVQS